VKCRGLRVTSLKCTSLSASVCHSVPHCLPLSATMYLTVCLCLPQCTSLSASVCHSVPHCLPESLKRTSLSALFGRNITKSYTNLLRKINQLGQESPEQMEGCQVQCTYLATVQCATLPQRSVLTVLNSLKYRN